MAARTASAICYLTLYVFLGGLTSLAVANAVSVAVTTIGRATTR